MTTQLIALNVSLLTFTTFILYVLIKYGQQRSVSAYYYKVHPALFSTVLFIFAISAIIAGSSLLIFFAGSGICLVAAAPNYRFKSEGDVHYAAAVSGILFGSIALVIWGYWYLVLPMMVVLIIIQLSLNNNDADGRTFWQEVIAFSSIELGILLHILKL